MTPHPVRVNGGPLHMAQPTGRGYATACGRHLHGPAVECPPRWRWAHEWQLSRLCKRCEGMADRCDTEEELARAAGWR